MSDCKKVVEKEGSIERLSKEVYRLQEALIIADISFGLIHEAIIQRSAVKTKKLQGAIYRALVRVMMLVYGFCEEYEIDIRELNIDVMRSAYKETKDEQ